MTRILLVSGNTRTASVHTAALRTAAELAPPGTTAVLFDGLRNLPPFVPGGHHPPEPVIRLRGEVAAADAVLFSTPEIAGSLPGSLKNLLDWLVDGGDLTGKSAAWLSLAPPGLDNGARSALEIVLGHAGATVLRAACIRNPIDPAGVDVTGVLADPQLRMALVDLLRALLLASAARHRPQPSWQTVSSVYPVVQRTDDRPLQDWRAQPWRR